MEISTPPKNSLAIIAFFLGFIGIGMAAFQNNFVPQARGIPASRPQGEGLKQAAAKAAVKLLEEKILHKEPPTKPMFTLLKSPLHPYQMVFTAFGVMAIGLGFLAWSRKDHVRLSGGAVALGIMTVAWQWILVAAAVAVVVLILSQLGV